MFRESTGCLLTSVVLLLVIIQQGDTSGLSMTGCTQPTTSADRHTKPQYPGGRYSIGAGVLYECLDGYSYAGGSQWSICQRDGQWSTPTLKCRETCGLPPVVVKADHDEGTDGYHPGSNVTYSCVEGYGGVAGEIMQYQCVNHTYGWTSPDEPLVCKEVCREFFVINGRVDPRGPIAYNRTVEVTCSNNYRIQGPPGCMCGDGGQWMGGYPECREVLCPSPPALRYGDMRAGGTSVGSTVSYVCDKGYTLVGDVDRTCLSDGQWSGVAATCQAVDCAPPPTDVMTCTTSTGTSYHDTVNCTCVFCKQRHFALTCNHDGKWSPNVREVCPSDCLLDIGSEIIKIAHGSHKAGQCQCRPNLNVSCHNGTLSPVSIKDCFPICALPSIQNGVVYVRPRQAWKLTDFQINLMLRCNDGYSLNGSEFTKCVCPGKWEPEVPHCTREGIAVNPLTANQEMPGPRVLEPVVLVCVGVAVFAMTLFSIYLGLHTLRLQRRKTTPTVQRGESQNIETAEEIETHDNSCEVTTEMMHSD